MPNNITMIDLLEAGIRARRHARRRRQQYCQHERNYRRAAMRFGEILSKASSGTRDRLTDGPVLPADEHSGRASGNDVSLTLKSARWLRIHCVTALPLSLLKAMQSDEAGDTGLSSDFI